MWPWHQGKSRARDGGGRYSSPALHCVADIVPDPSPSMQKGLFTPQGPLQEKRWTPGGEQGTARGWGSRLWGPRGLPRVAGHLHGDGDRPRPGRAAGPCLGLAWRGPWPGRAALWGPRDGSCCGTAGTGTDSPGGADMASWASQSFPYGLLLWVASLAFSLGEELFLSFMPRGLGPALLCPSSLHACFWQGRGDSFTLNPPNWQGPSREQPFAGRHAAPSPCPWQACEERRVSVLQLGPPASLHSLGGRHDVGHHRSPHPALCPTQPCWTFQGRMRPFSQSCERLPGSALCSMNVSGAKRAKFDLGQADIKELRQKLAHYFWASFIHA